MTGGRRAGWPGVDLYVLALVCMLSALAVSRWSDVDLNLSRQFFEPLTGHFPRREDVLWRRVLHDGLKWLAVLGWTGGLVFWCAARGPAASRRRRDAAFVLATSLAVVLTVSGARAMSAHSCPWSLSAFGGAAQYFRLFDAVPAAAGAGRCLPSGHASSAFMWLALLPVLRTRTRRFVLAAVLLGGVFAGWVQVARGAHFLSHVLLSGAISALVVACGEILYGVHGRCGRPGACSRGGVAGRR
jgi:membrane-associated PAP2 superfamily phosphatase